MHIGQRHAVNADGIGQLRFGLPVLVGCRIRFQLRRFGILLLVIAEVTHQQLHRLFRLEFDGCTHLTLLVAVERESLQAHQLRSQVLYSTGNVAEQTHTLVELHQRSSTGQLHIGSRQCLNGFHCSYPLAVGPVFQHCQIGFKVSQFLFIMYQQLFPSFVFTVVATNGDATLSRLHAVGIIISILGQTHQLAVMLQALFHQRHGSIEVGHVLTPLIIEYQFGSLHLEVESIGKLTVAMHVVAQAVELILVLTDACRSTINSRNGLVAMLNNLCHYIQRKLTHVWLLLPFLLNKFNQLLTFGTAALIEARIDGVFIRIHQLTHEHTQQQRLAVTLGDTETAKQLRRNFTRLLISLQYVSCCIAISTVILT